MNKTISALNAYNKREKEATDLLFRLGDLVNRYSKGETINWGHVGVMAQAIEYLENAADLLAEEE